MKEVYSLSEDLQEKLREEEYVKCLQLIQQEQQQQQLRSQRARLYEEDISTYSFQSSSDVTGTLFGDETRLKCDRTWDGLMCWPEAMAGSVVRLLCPQYHLFYKTKYASKHCMQSGHWFVHPVYNNTWTDYSECISNNSLSDLPPSSTVNITNHLGMIKTICRTGYGLSIVSLLIAISTMLYFKKLRCPRNTLHIHLFASFILRATMWFIHELFVGGLGLPKDVQVIDGQIVFRDDVSHWECRLIMVLFNYAMTSNYLWIFTEGLYLHNLIFVDVFSESSSVKFYIIFGWCSSLAFLVPWIIVRAVLENELCWNTNPNPLFFWIIKLPLAISILVNFFFFVHILRELFVKLKASSNLSSSRKHRHRRLAKSTLVLIPLMGVPYVVFLGLPDELNETAELIKLYFEMFFNSFNGLIVATLYCFVNAEVRLELRKVCGGDDLYGLSQQDASRRVSQLHVNATGSSHRSGPAPPPLNPPRNTFHRSSKDDQTSTEVSAFLGNASNITTATVTFDSQYLSCGNTIDSEDVGPSNVRVDRLFAQNVPLGRTPEETEADLDNATEIRTTCRPTASLNYVRVLPSSDDDLKSSMSTTCDSLHDVFNTSESLVNMT